MILVVDLCYEMNSLSEYEFVHPIVQTLKRSGFRLEVMHYKAMHRGMQKAMHCKENGTNEVDMDGLEKFSRIILCGTALKDNIYLEQLDLFHWIRDWKKPVLGICAGMQVIGRVFGGNIVSQPAIGLEKIDILEDSALMGEQREIEGYHLHNYGVTLPDRFRLLAGSPTRVEAFCHEELPIYGIIFHPEVRNRWILDRFARLGYQ
jgi:GMP synthase-like glutamine amidotransferase